MGSALIASIDIVARLLHGLMGVVAQNQSLGMPPQGGGMHYGGGMVMGAGMFVCFGLAGLLFFAFWVWMLIDCLTREFPESNDKIIWVLVIILLSAFAIGAIVYFFVGRPRGSRMR